MRLQQLLTKVKSYNKKANLDLISKAYEYAYEFHKNKKRASGELFIQHPLNVAYILAEHNLDDASITASLLHDTLEDTPASLYLQTT